MPGKLTKEEFETMKEHTLIDASMLDKLEHYKDEKMIKIAYQICRWHHERYDGKGYPDGLIGEHDGCFGNKVGEWLDVGMYRWSCG